MNFFVLLLVFQKSLNFSLFFKFVLHSKVKQTKTNLQKYFHPSPLNHLTVHILSECICSDAHMQCRKPKRLLRYYMSLKSSCYHVEDFVDGALPPCGGFRKNGALLPRGGFRTNLRFFTTW